jgi:hypothetical protein
MLPVGKALPVADALLFNNSNTPLPPDVKGSGRPTASAKAALAKQRKNTASTMYRNRNMITIPPIFEYDTRYDAVV